MEKSPLLDDAARPEPKTRRAARAGALAAACAGAAVLLLAAAPAAPRRGAVGALAKKHSPVPSHDSDLSYSYSDPTAAPTYAPTPSPTPTPEPSTTFTPTAFKPTSSAPTASALPTAAPTTWLDTVEQFLNYSLSSIEQETSDCVINSALCSDAVCTLNSDGLTASCGCLKMPATRGNPAQLAVSWSSFVLATSPKFVELVESCVSSRGCGVKQKQKLCDYAKDGSLWSDVGIDSSKLSKEYPLSMWSVNPLTSGNTSSDGNLYCDNAMCAQCMGAPCFDQHYDSVFDLTCVCPVTSIGGTCKYGVDESRKDGGLCDEISADKPACAACTGGVSGGGYTKEKDAQTVVDFIDAIVTASNEEQWRKVAPEQCPSYGALAPLHEGDKPGLGIFSYGYDDDDKSLASPLSDDGAAATDANDDDATKRRSGGGGGDDDDSAAHRKKKGGGGKGKGRGGSHDAALRRAAEAAMEESVRPR